MSSLTSNNNKAVGPWTSAPSSPQDGDIWIQ